MAWIMFLHGWSTNKIYQHFDCDYQSPKSIIALPIAVICSLCQNESAVAQLHERTLRTKLPWRSGCFLQTMAITCWMHKTTWEQATRYAKQLQRSTVHDQG